jgi:streptomycin 6-kinase
VRADGTEAILKMGVPNPELTTEIEALSAFGGRGAVRLLAVDRARGALLLERLRPGAPLWSVPDDEEATRIAARLMRQLWRPVPGEHPFPTTRRWALGFDRMRARFQGGTGPLPAALTGRAEALFRDLLASAGEPVLLHGDLHHDNILSARRRPWLAIDPKGVVGEPAYETGALLRNPVGRLLGEPDPAGIIARRVEILAAKLDMDRHRLLDWGLAQAVLAAWWCVEDGQDCWQVLLQHAAVIEAVVDG